jgi:integrase/recombinase XerD
VRKAKPIPINFADPDGLGAWMRRYLEALRMKNYSARTIENRQLYVGRFVRWCDERSVTRPEQVTKPILDRYKRHLFHFRRPNGKPLTFNTQIQALTPVRGFFKWLTRNDVLLWNPASEIDLPKQEKRLPKAVLSVAEAEAILAQPNVNDLLGLRDRAILEVLYSTGIRRMEVINLRVFDLDAERGTLMVRLGKGKKDRMVPIGARAAGWVARYVNDARPKLMMPPDEGVLFLTQDGQPIGTDRMSQLVGEHVAAADVGKLGSCHMFRHTCATLMLEGGADVRYVQEMLGHADLSTTAIYTQVSIRKLKAVHELTHPACKTEADAPTPAGPTKVDARELLSALDAEGAEER